MTRLLVRVDGVSRAQLGGVGIMVRVREVEDGPVLQQHSELLVDEDGTDAQARYAALIEAIDMVRDSEAEEVVFVTDSNEFRAELVGKRAPREECVGLHRVTLRALGWALAGRWSVVWVPLGSAGK